MVELQERPDGLLQRSFGGDTLNTAIYLARLGVRVDYVTALGDDRLSDDMLHSWRQEGIGTDRVRRVPGRLPGMYLIQTDAFGERCFFYWRENAAARHLFDAHESPDLRGFDLVYLSGITISIFSGNARDRLFTMLAQARAEGTRIAFDMNYRVAGWPDTLEAATAYRRALDLADIVFASEADASGVFGTGGVAELNRLSELVEVVVKLDRPACRVRHRGLEVTCEAPPVQHVVDTTAAGDSFAAAYLASRSRGVSPKDAADAGHALAGVVIAYRGAIAPRTATSHMTAGAS